MPGPRLSEHIILGDTLRVRNPIMWLDFKSHYAGLPCGCALGGAMLSLGFRGSLRSEEITQQWPWLETAQILLQRNGFKVNASPLDAISTLFHDVFHGRMTLEELAVQVRVWEDEYDENLRAGATDEADEPAVASKTEKEVLA